MPSLDSLITVFAVVSDAYLRQHNYKSYREATDNILGGLSTLKAERNRAKARENLKQHGLPAPEAEVKKDAASGPADTKVSNIPTLRQEFDSLTDKELTAHEMARIHSIFKNGSEKSKESFAWTPSTPKFAEDILYIHNQWKLDKYENAKQKTLESLADRLLRENETLKALQQQSGETKKDQKDELLAEKDAQIAAKDAQLALAAKDTQLAAKDAQLLAKDQIIASLQAEIQRLQFASLPAIGAGRDRSHSDTSSNKSFGLRSTLSGVSTATTKPQDKAPEYYKHSEQILGTKRLTFIKQLIPHIATESKDAAPVPYNKLVEILCQDALSAKPKATNLLVLDWLKKESIDPTKFPVQLKPLESLPDNPNPHYFTPGKGKNNEAGYLLGYAIQIKAFGYDNIVLAKQLVSVKAPPSIAVSEAPKAASLSAGVETKSDTAPTAPVAAL